MISWLIHATLILVVIVLLLGAVAQACGMYLAWKLYKEQKQKKTVMTGICPDKTTAEALKSTNFRG